MIKIVKMTLFGRKNRRTTIGNAKTRQAPIYSFSDRNSQFVMKMILEEIDTLEEFTIPNSQFGMKMILEEIDTLEEFTKHKF